MPRPKNVDPPVHRTITLPTSTCEKIDILLVDPIQQRKRYGAFSQLINELLVKWAKGEIKL